MKGLLLVGLLLRTLRTSILPREKHSGRFLSGSLPGLAPFYGGGGGEDSVEMCGRTSVLWELELPTNVLTSGLLPLPR